MFKLIAFLFVCAISITAASNTTYTYKTIGNLSIQLDVYVPDSTPYSKYPVLFMIHGGGYVFGAKDEFSPSEVNETLSRGWVGVSIDYRLSPAVLVSDIMQDVQDAYTWVRTNLVQYVNIDPDCITVFGGSAGGGLSLMSGYMLTPRPKAIIAFCPFCTNCLDPYVYNPATPVNITLVEEIHALSQNITEYALPGLTDPRFLLLAASLHARKLGWMLLSEDQTEDPSQVLGVLTDYSAVYNVDVNYPPTYLGHGLNDSLVPYNQSTQMAEALAAKNVSYILDLVPGANHAYDGSAVPPSALWQDHVLPAFDFAQHYMANSEEMITN